MTAIWEFKDGRLRLLRNTRADQLITELGYTLDAILNVPLIGGGRATVHERAGEAAVYSFMVCVQMGPRAELIACAELPELMGYLGQLAPLQRTPQPLVNVAPAAVSVSPQIVMGPAARPEGVDTEAQTLTLSLNAVREIHQALDILHRAAMTGPGEGGMSGAAQRVYGESAYRLIKARLEGRV